MQYAMTENTQGVCPAGWHLPSDGDWDVVKDFLGGETLAGGNPGNQSRSYDYNNMGYYGYFWSSSQADDYTAWGREKERDEMNPTLFYQLWRSNLGKRTEERSDEGAFQLRSHNSAMRPRSKKNIRPCN